MANLGPSSDGTRSIRHRPHDFRGAKTFISNGILADVVITVVSTDPAAGANRISLLVLERGMPGFGRGPKLDKIGLPAQDTAELSFTDVRVPAIYEHGAIINFSYRTEVLISVQM